MRNLFVAALSFAAIAWGVQQLSLTVVDIKLLFQDSNECEVQETSTESVDELSL